MAKGRIGGKKQMIARTQRRSQGGSMAKIWHIGWGGRGGGGVGTLNAKLTAFSEMTYSA